MANWRVVDIIQSSADYLARKDVPDPRLDAELLLGKVLDKERLQLYLFFDRPLSSDELDTYRGYIKRRGDREPLQHILGKTGFMNALLKTTPAALIPRPETEVLVETALSFARDRFLRILDIGTGSGCIAISLAMELKKAEVHALDISESALKLARENAQRNNANITFSSLDILSETPAEGRRFDLVVSNPPYIALSEKPDLQKEVSDFDPAIALFDASDGLGFYRRFIEILPELLVAGGRFLFEFGGKPQENVLLDLFLQGGYHNLEIIQDYNGEPRVISGIYKP